MLLRNAYGMNENAFLLLVLTTIMPPSNHVLLIVCCCGVVEKPGWFRCHEATCGWCEECGAVIDSSVVFRCVGPQGDGEVCFCLVCYAVILLVRVYQCNITHVVVSRSTSLQLVRKSSVRSHCILHTHAEEFVRGGSTEINRSKR